MISKSYHCITEGTDPFYNIALEENLLRRVETGEIILYLWQNARTVVIGRNQNAWAQCRVSQLEADGGRLARRLSGGGAVYHDLGNLNFTFLVRAGDYDVARQTRVILRALGAFGIDAEISGRNDITVGSRKCSGSAYYRSGDRCYHHGTLLVDANADDMSRYLTVDPEKLSSKSVDSVRSRIVNLRELTPSMTVAKLKAGLVSSFDEEYGLCSVPLVFNSDDIAERRDFFASWDWRFGTAASFSSEMHERFPWGDLRLCFAVEHGIVTGVKLYSDGLEADFLASLPDVFAGCRYTAEALKSRLAGVKTSDGSEKQILSDAASLIGQIFFMEENSNV